jgi:thioredoxin reductase (NADPH)
VKPLISVVESDEALSTDLGRRFGADYDIAVASDAQSGLEQLAEAAGAGRSVALVIAPLWTGGIEYFVRARELHPRAKRLLMIVVGDVGAQPDIRRALTLDQIDFFFGTPWASPEEELYPVVNDALRLWAREHQPRYEKAAIVDSTDAGRGRELFSNLERNTVWTSFHLLDSDSGRALAREHGFPTDRMPVLILWDGRVLIDPADDELAESMGARTHPGDEVYDLAVVGGGPAGLAAAAYAASEGLTVLGIEARVVGGQAATTSKIRNYLGFRWGVSGDEFGGLASRHAEDLGADMIIMRSAVGLRAEGDVRVVELDNGEMVKARAVVLAGGVAYRRLGVPSVDDLAGAGVFYGGSAAEARSMSGLDVFVVGGGNSAGQIATHLAGVGATTTLLIRAEQLGPPMTQYLIDEIGAAKGLTVRPRTQVVGAAGSALQLEELVLRDTKTGEEETVYADALFVFIGADPHTEWLRGTAALDDNGFVMTGREIPSDAWALERAPAFLETSMPGVFAAGDIRHRSVKRVAAAVGEGSTATLLVRDYLDALDDHG